MGMIAKFVSSKVSGYALIALLIAAAGAGYWFWSELKEFGSLEAISQAQAQTIRHQANTLAVIQAESEKRQKINTALTKQMSVIKRTFGAAKRRIQNAEANADKALKQCMAMHLADGMQFGPSSEDADSEDKARAKLDG